MIRLLSLIRWIVGRIKIMRYAAGLALSLMLIPLGYYLMIEGLNYQAQAGGFLSIITGVVLFFIVWSKSVKAERIEREKNDEKFNAVIREIQGLRQDMNDILKQERNERNKPR